MCPALLAGRSGPTFYLLLIPLCVISSSHKLLVPAAAGSPRGRKAILALFVLATASLGTAAGVQYFRVSRMTPIQKVQRVEGTPGVDIVVARLARSKADPLEDYRAILASIESPLVARAISRHIECPERDFECADVLVTVLEAFEGLGGLRGRDRVLQQLRSTSGLELPPGTQASTWRAKLAELEMKSRLCGFSGPWDP